MIREVCLYDKFSFCKNGVRCLKIHLKETCQNRECDYMKCNKRHPRPCRIFRMNGYCRFGTSCRYSHRLPKEVEDQNNKIESMEKVNAKLLKQVEDQNVEIKELKKKMLDIESKELKNLQNQINDLVKKNNEKEIAIKNLNVVSNNCGLDEQDDCDDNEEDVELEEKETNIEKEQEINHPEYVQNALECAKEAYDNIQKQVAIEEVIVSHETCKAETGKKATIKYAHNCLKQVEKLEADISKIRKNAKDLGTTLTIKCDEFFNRLDQIEVNEELCEDVTEIVENLRDVLSFAERKPNKERDLRSIVSCKEYLKRYINNPKRPSQILLSSCCKRCNLSPKVTSFQPIDPCEPSHL